jgi:hypothetical protein
MGQLASNLGGAKPAKTQTLNGPSPNGPARRHSVNKSPGHIRQIPIWGHSDDNWQFDWKDQERGHKTFELRTSLSGLKHKIQDIADKNRIRLSHQPPHFKGYDFVA